MTNGETLGALYTSGVGTNSRENKLETTLAVGQPDSERKKERESFIRTKEQCPWGFRAVSVWAVATPSDSVC